MPLAALFETQEIVPGGEARYTPSTYTSTDAALDFVNSEIGTAPLTTLSLAGFTILTTAAEAPVAPPSSSVRKLQRKITTRPTKPYPTFNPRITHRPPQACANLRRGQHRAGFGETVEEHTTHRSPD